MTYEDLIKLTSNFNLILTEKTVSQIDQYLDMVVEANKTMNLTSIDEKGEMIEKHVFDSLLCAKLTSFDGKTLLDVGTGAGFPGVILAIAFPTLKVTLVDATKKKTLFLEKVVENLHLKNNLSSKKEN